MKELIKTWVVREETETAAIANELFSTLKAGDRMVLTGGLGAGKTTLIRYLCEHLQIERVTSPTFAIVNTYNARIPVYHFDFYRLTDSVELFEIGYYEYLEDSASIIFIEWGEMFPEVLPQNRYELLIEQNGDQEIRTVSLTRINK